MYCTKFPCCSKNVRAFGRVECGTQCVNITISIGNCIEHDRSLYIAIFILQRSFCPRKEPLIDASTAKSSKVHRVDRTFRSVAFSKQELTRITEAKRSLSLLPRVQISIQPGFRGLCLGMGITGKKANFHNCVRTRDDERQTMFLGIKARLL